MTPKCNVLKQKQTNKQTKKQLQSQDWGKVSEVSFLIAKVKGMPKTQKQR
jgi:hypothetical protein